MSATQDLSAFRSQWNALFPEANASNVPPTGLPSAILQRLAIGAAIQMQETVQQLVAEVKGLRSDSKPAELAAVAGEATSSSDAILRELLTEVKGLRQQGERLFSAEADDEPVPEIDVPPAIGQVWAKQGGIYAGVARGVNGARDHHLILRAETVRPGNVTWKAAMDWAATAAEEDGLGWTLPTRAESALLFANLKDQFEARYHWTCEVYEGDSSYAWGQYFGGGYQSFHHQSYEGRARAVRRLPLQSFNPS